MLHFPYLFIWSMLAIAITVSLLFSVCIATYKTLPVAFTQKHSIISTINIVLLFVHIQCSKRCMECSLYRGEVVTGIRERTGRTQNIDCRSTPVGPFLCFYILYFQLLCKFRTRTELLLEKRGSRRFYFVLTPSTNQTERVISVATPTDSTSNYYIRIFGLYFLW